MVVQLTPVNLIKDEQNIRGFEFNQSIIAPQTIPQIIEIKFPSLNSNEVGKFNLSSQLNCDLLVKSFDLNIKHDDAESIQDTQYHVGNTPLVFFLKDPNTNNLIRKITAQITGYPVEPFYFLFHRNLDIYIKSSAGFHSLTFYCEPIHVSNIIQPTKL